MYDQRDNTESPTRIRLQPAATGRGLPVPPLIPLVAVLSLLVGLGVGSQFSTGRSPTVTPTAADITYAPTGEDPVWGPPASFEVAISFPPSSDTELPPADGLSLEKALAALTDAGFRGSSSVVISARVVRFGDVGWDSSTSADEWVWVFVVNGDFGDVVMTGPTCTAAPAAHSPVASPRAPGSPSAVTSLVASSSEPTAEQSAPCARPLATATVILDYRSGLMIEAQIPAPGPYSGG